jgi:hypothetical protein
MAIIKRKVVVFTRHPKQERLPVRTWPKRRREHEDKERGEHETPRLVKQWK